MNSTNKPAALQPSILVLFGITGDLAKRKVLPAIYHLYKDGLLDENTLLVGTSRRPLAAADFLKQIELCVLETDNVCNPEVLALMERQLHLLQLDPENGGDYTGLAELLQSLEDEQGSCLNRLFYLSIPPSVYLQVVTNLGKHGLNGSCRHGRAATRLLVEKPFGSDLVSARQLIELTGQAFSEEQIFRIDHYLAKETVQNILTFRRRNPIFSELWNSRHISRIAVAAYEKIGIEGRAGFYENVGALRDLVQSHLLQLLGLTTMELPPEPFDADAIHEAKQALLQQLVLPDPQAVIRGQYEGYRTEVANPASTTETFVSMRLAIDTPAWRGTDVVVSTGKALAEKRTEIVLQFGKGQAHNSLTFRLQPNEGIDIELTVKQPGFEHQLQTAKMDFSYQQTFQLQHPDAYERVLVDAVRGDHTLFATAGEVLASWQALQPVLDAWAQAGDDLQTYPTGSQPLELPADGSR